MEQYKDGRVKTTRTQDQCISKELLGETNTPDQAKDWHYGTSGSVNTDETISDRPRGNPRPQQRDWADPLDQEPRPTVVRRKHPRPRDPADGGLSPPQRHLYAGVQGRGVGIDDTDIRNPYDQGYKIGHADDAQENRTSHLSDLYHAMPPSDFEKRGGAGCLEHEAARQHK